MRSREVGEAFALDATGLDGTGKAAPGETGAGAIGNEVAELAPVAELSTIEAATGPKSSAEVREASKRVLVATATLLVTEIDGCGVLLELERLGLTNGLTVLLLAAPEKMT